MLSASCIADGERERADVGECLQDPNRAIATIGGNCRRGFARENEVKNTPIYHKSALQ
jgi:hypothetical protein